MRTQRFVTRRSTLANIVLALFTAVSIGVRRAEGAHPAAPPPRRRKPRFHATPKKIAVLQGRSGWYWNVVQSRGGGQTKVLHFVKPAYAFRHKAINGPRRLAKTVRHPAGRIRGVGSLNVGKLVRFTGTDFPLFGAGSSRLNTQFYSEGIESTALKAWVSGDKDRAIAILQTGLSYVGPGERNKPFNIRLCELLAGLLVRRGRQGEIPAVFAPVEQELVRARLWLAKAREQATVSDADRKDNAQHERKKLERYVQQLELLNSKWSDSQGKWSRKWQTGAKRRWDGIDI